ncbi:MAG: acyltransferase [Lachnospiraceae bacterium]|nr:acyltransferase [Lachnospiraceae bacterium]
MTFDQIKLQTQIRKLNNGRISFFAMIKNPQHIKIGKGVSIAYGTRIEPVCQWGKRKYRPSIVIGDGVNIEQGCHITCADSVVIGKGASLLPYCMITDISHDYQNINLPPNRQGITVKRTTIGEHTTIGFGACVMPGVTVGKHCVIGANSVVNQDIPDFCVVVGAPARIVKRYDKAKGEWVDSHE